MGKLKLTSTQDNYLRTVARLAGEAPACFSRDERALVRAGLLSIQRVPGRTARVSVTLLGKEWIQNATGRPAS